MHSSEVTLVTDQDQLTATFLRTALADTLTRNHRIVLQLTADMPEAASLVSLVEDGSHMNWLVGHLVGNRDSILALLGVGRVRPEEVDEAFGYGSKPAAEATATLAEQVRAYDLTNVPLLAAIAALTPEQLAAPASRRTVRERLEFLVWHETYHLGQLMLYRRAAGLDNPIG